MTKLKHLKRGNSIKKVAKYLTKKLRKCACPLRRRNINKGFIVTSDCNIDPPIMVSSDCQIRTSLREQTIECFRNNNSDPLVTVGPVATNENNCDCDGAYRVFYELDFLKVLLNNTQPEIDKLTCCVIEVLKCILGTCNITRESTELPCCSAAYDIIVTVNTNDIRVATVCVFQNSADWLGLTRFDLDKILSLWK